MNTKIGKRRQARLHSSARAGFTLVEMIVAVALFAIVMLVCVSSLLAMVGANRKVQALQSVLNNLNVTLDGMTRSIRMGTSFDGSVSCTSHGSSDGPKDCAGGTTQFSFQPYGSSGQATIYRLNTSTHQLERSTNGGSSYAAMTSPDITIDNMLFYVVGASRGCAVSPCDLTQPKVVIMVKGTAPIINSQARTTFHIQVTAVQRLLDL